MKGSKKKKKADTKLTVKKTAPKGKAAKDPNKPKRPASAVFVFMEAFWKHFKEEIPTINSVAAVDKAGGSKRKPMSESESEKAPFVAEAEQRKTAGISSVQSVISNNDLLTEILLKLPVLSLVLFKSVSKHWLSLIKDANVTFRRNLDPLSGLFLKKISHKNYSESFSYNFVPLDIRIPLLATSFTDVHGDFEILHSCNGLLLCRTLSWKLYVYNPSITNMLKLIPEPDYMTSYHYSLYGGLKMAFDPTKSPYYKVIYADMVEGIWVQIRTYSSETGNWSLRRDQFPHPCFLSFQHGVYWNDAIYWLNYNLEGKLFRLNIMNEDPVLTALPTPLTLDGKVNYNYSLFESRGCLLLVRKDNGYSLQFTMYEKGNMYSEWSVKYIVNLDDIINPEWWGFCATIFCIVLGEREEDSFLVWQLGRKVVQYKIVSKTLITISDLGPNDVGLVSCFQFIPSFANV